MQIQSIAGLVALATSALAAPMPEPAVNMMAAGTQWTIEKFTRTCNSANTSCKYSYNINTHSATVTPCSYTVNANTASRASYNNVRCGAYTISSSWSGQFGPNNGFQTLAVVKNRQIIYPAYSDKQIQNGKAVSPDQSYTPANLP